jgi:hypothetical protein
MLPSEQQPVFSNRIHWARSAHFVAREEGKVDIVAGK